MDIHSGVVIHRLQGHLLHYGPLHKLQCGTCSTVVLPIGCSGNLCAGAWNTSSPSLFDGLAVYRAVSLIYFLHFYLSCCILSFLKYIFPEVPPAWLIDSSFSSSGSILKTAVPSCAQHGGSPSLFPKEITPAAPQLLNPCHRHPIHTERKIFLFFYNYLSCYTSLLDFISSSKWEAFIVLFPLVQNCSSYFILEHESSLFFLNFLVMGGREASADR